MFVGDVDHLQRCWWSLCRITRFHFVRQTIRRFHQLLLDFCFFIEFSILRVGTAQCSGIPIKTNANYLGRLDAYTASVAALQPTYSDDRPWWRQGRSFCFFFRPFTKCTSQPLVTVNFSVCKCLCLLSLISPFAKWLSVWISNPNPSWRSPPHLVLYSRQS